MTQTAQYNASPGKRSHSVLTRLLAGLAVVLGWLLQDLAVVATAGRPEDLFRLGPQSLAALGGGLAFGALSRWKPLVPAGLAVTAIWSLLPRLTSARFSHAEAWLPRALFLLIAAFGVALVIGRLRIGPVRLALLLGILAAAMMAWLRDASRGPEVTLTVCAALAVPLGFFGTMLRPLGEVLLAAAVAWAVGGQIPAQLKTERPDLPRPQIPAPVGVPNLILVVLDTVRADRLGCYGYERPTTPKLDRWAKEHFTLYSNARSTSSWTLPSHASLFTGLLPAEHGATHPGLHAHPVKAGTPTLAQHLYENGYRTGGVFANNVYLRPRFNLDVGFERFDDRKASMFGKYLPLAQLLGSSLRVGRLGYRDGRLITQLGLEWIDSLLVREDVTDDEGNVIDSIMVHNDPFFLALNYMEVHTPNIPPPPFNQAFGDEQPVDPISPGLEFQSLNYDRELLHLDHQVHRLLRGLADRELFDNSVIIITADHGEALGDHGFLMHGWTLYEELVHVPLLVKPAGGRTAERIDDSVTSADVFRMAFDLLGIEVATPPVPDAAPASEWYVIDDGVGEVFKLRYPDRDLTQDMTTWIEGDRKFIVSENGAVEAYDLSRDPGELTPIELTPEERQAAVDRARAWWDAHDISAPPAATASEEDLERLRHLGYLGDDDAEDE